ncbi:TetR/AcrR family transcriptional regulator [Yersinia alsatica]|uniref:TetR family transcriptional regulator n=1 Tax=Yersinia alsatica TaxID=2890317 RepID=A0ABY5UUI3_9GAMM|nr:TetR/AcrR family transcriptional regulator [Yersinia alsatica]UWM47158.1 TetR family transcriptional regulator [Yersinia alsatica]
MDKDRGCNVTEDRKIIRKRDAAQTQMRILAAATEEFSQKGFDGARVEQIATQADINKQLIYHYFKNKDELFTRVLEDAYRNIREQEAALQLDHLPANEAILELVDFTWRYYLAHPEFIRLLSSENQQKARHLQQSKSIDDINLSWRGISQTLIERGEREKTIKPGIDAMQLNISISALGFFYLINNATLSIVYQQDLTTPEALEKRLAVMKDTIACWIKP